MKKGIVAALVVVLLAAGATYVILHTNKKAPAKVSTSDSGTTPARNNSTTNTKMN